MICAGIDGGSRAVKVVLLRAADRAVLAEGVCDQQVNHEQVASELLDHLLASAGLARSAIGYAVATGYGRRLIRFADTTITEITCHARGVRWHRPDARSVLEIGGQDSKVIRLDPAGRVEDFAMNDRCAAGTGRFLEMAARLLKTDLAAFGAVAATAAAPADVDASCRCTPTAISSMCAVFAETEIIGHLAGGARTADLVAGVQAAIARRMAALAGAGLAGPVVFTGGVARVSGMDQALSVALGLPVAICPAPQMTGALGAALLACDRVLAPAAK